MSLHIAAFLNRNRHDTYYFGRLVRPDLVTFLPRERFTAAWSRENHVEARYRVLLVALQAAEAGSARVGPDLLATAEDDTAIVGERAWCMSGQPCARGADGACGQRTR